MREGHKMATADLELKPQGDTWVLSTTRYTATADLKVYHLSAALLGGVPFGGEPSIAMYATPTSLHLS